MNTEKVIRQLHSFLSLSAENIEFCYSKQLQGRQWVACFTINFGHGDCPIVQDFLYDVTIEVYLSDTNVQSITVKLYEPDAVKDFNQFCGVLRINLHNTWGKTLYWKEVFENNQNFDMAYKYDTCTFYAVSKSYEIELEKNK